MKKNSQHDITYFLSFTFKEATIVCDLSFKMQGCILTANLTWPLA